MNMVPSGREKAIGKRLEVRVSIRNCRFIGKPIELWIDFGGKYSIVGLFTVALLVQPPFLDPPMIIALPSCIRPAVVYHRGLAIRIRAWSSSISHASTESESQGANIRIACNPSRRPKSAAEVKSSTIVLPPTWISDQLLRKVPPAQKE